MFEPRLPDASETPAAAPSQPTSKKSWFAWDRATVLAVAVIVTTVIAGTALDIVNTGREVGALRHYRETGEILSPSMYANVPMKVTVTGTFSHLPNNNVLWLASQQFSKNSTTQPEINPLTTDPPESSSGRWRETFFVGNPKAPTPPNNEYAILLLSLTPQQADEFREYNLQKTLGTYQGTGLPRGAVVLDSVDIYRKS